MKDEHSQMIEDCMSRDTSMSEWEQEFMQSIYEWMADGGNLTERQADKLNNIWEKIT